MKLTCEERDDIVLWYCMGVRQVDIAEAFGVTQAYVSILAKQYGARQSRVTAQTKPE